MADSSCCAILSGLEAVSRAEDFIAAAHMAARCGTLDSREANAMVRLLDEAEDALQSVKTALTDMKDAKQGASVAAARESE